MIFEGQCLQVQLLPACAPAAREWDAANQREALRTFAAIDAQLTMAARAYPRSRAERVKGVSIAGGVLLEVKAPPRGKVITRLLCYQPKGYDWYIALVREKKSQELPMAWARTAKSRIDEARERGLL